MGVLCAGRQTRWRRLVLVVLFLCGAALPGAFYVRTWYHYRAAQANLERYHFAEARDHFAIVLRAWPNSRRVRLLAARAARMDDAIEEAEYHLHLARQARPTEPDVLLEGALLRASTGNLASVEEYLLDRLRRGSPETTLIQEAFIKGYTRLYRIAQALAGVEDWLSRQPDDTQALFLRGCIWQQAQNPQNALLSYRRVVELDPQRDDARWRLAQCLLGLNLSAEARTHLEYLHPRYPRNEEMTVALARAQFGQGQLTEVRQLLQEVLAEHPDCVAALTERGRLALTADNDAVEAETWLQQAAYLNPRNPQILQLLSTTLVRQGKQDEARVLQDQLKQTDGDFKRLEEICQHQLGQRPNDVALQTETGALLLRLGCLEAGRAWLLHVLNENPNYAPARAALDKVTHKSKP